MDLFTTRLLAYCGLSWAASVVVSLYVYLESENEQDVKKWARRFILSVFVGWAIPTYWALATLGEVAISIGRGLWAAPKTVIEDAALGELVPKRTLKRRASEPGVGQLSKADSSGGELSVGGKNDD